MPERDQALLGAVVQVALDPPQLGLLLVDGPGPGRLEPVDPLPQLARSRGEDSHIAASHTPAAAAPIASSGHTGQK